MIRAKICSWRVKGIKRKRDSWIPECMWRVIYLTRYAWFVNYLFLVVKISFSWSFSDLTSHHLRHLAQTVLWQSVTFEMFLPTSNPQFWACRKFEIQKSNEWATGHSSIKNSKACASRGEGAQQTEVNPTHRIEPEVCLTLQVEPQNGVSHFKHPSCTVLEYTRDLMR